jgi:hypothetical protein
VFGFELDQTREYVEQWQELYHIDYCPVPLLRRLGPNFGVQFESGVGDIRYRSLLSQIGHLYGIRGTRRCLERVCSAVSKYECDVTQTGNLMTLPDDSDFFEGVGNWDGDRCWRWATGITRQGVLQGQQGRATTCWCRSWCDGGMDRRG